MRYAGSWSAPGRSTGPSVVRRLRRPALCGTWLHLPGLRLSRLHLTSCIASIICIMPCIICIIAGAAPWLAPDIMGQFIIMPPCAGGGRIDAGCIVMPGCICPASSSSLPASIASFLDIVHHWATYHHAAWHGRCRCLRRRREPVSRWAGGRGLCGNRLRSGTAAEATPSLSSVALSGSPVTGRWCWDW